jgi:phage baseplate assembly protein W
MAVAMAIARWEPRIAVSRILLDGEFAAGSAVITVIGRRTDVPQANSLTRLTIPIR